MILAVGSETHKHILVLISLMKFLRIWIPSQKYLKNLAVSWFLETQWLFTFSKEATSLSFFVKDPSGCLHNQGSSILKIIKMRFGLFIRYFSRPFFADSCCWKGISCYNLVLFYLRWREILLKRKRVYKYFVQDCTSCTLTKQVTLLLVSSFEFVDISSHTIE